MNRIKNKDVWMWKPLRILMLAALVWVVFIPPTYAFSARLGILLQTPSHRSRPPTTERRQDLSSLQTFMSSNSLIEGTSLQHNQDSTNGDQEFVDTEHERTTFDSDEPRRVFEMSATNSAPAQQVTTHEESQAGQSVRKYWRPLFSMCRPANFAGVILFHLLGTKLAVERIPNVAMTAKTLAQPSLVVVLTALLFISATSMVVNDYFDYKSGVDSKKANKPLVEGKVPLQVTKRFLTGLYACLMVLVAVSPATPVRLLEVVSLMMTFWYTNHLKPVTWLKNVVCASIIALSPCTSGAAAYQLISGEQWGILKATKMWRLAAMLFFGFLGREIVMDCNDVKDDTVHNVLTVPVVYGQRFASAISLACIFVMGLLGVIGAGSMRQIALAATGWSIMLFRHWQAFRTNGGDPDVVCKAVEQGKSTILVLLASYI